MKKLVSSLLLVGCLGCSDVSHDSNSSKIDRLKFYENFESSMSYKDEAPQSNSVLTGKIKFDGKKCEKTIFSESLIENKENVREKKASNWRYFNDEMEEKSDWIVELEDSLRGLDNLDISLKMYVGRYAYIRNACDMLYNLGICAYVFDKSFLKKSLVPWVVSYADDGMDLLEDMLYYDFLEEGIEDKKARGKSLKILSSPRKYFERYEL